VPTRTLPSGTVTFLFTDVEGSTRLLHALGTEGYADALAAHRRTLRDAFITHGGVEVDTQGDAFFVAFPTAPGALAAARDASAALVDGPIRVRIGLHTGTPLLTDEGYVGADVHKGARIAAAGHGGQVLLSATTAALVDHTDLRDLGEHRLKDLTAPERIFQADPGEHPPLATLHQTNLPIPATPFLGREAELNDIGARILRDDVRLVTLTGPGGTGKTRLALQAVANTAEHFPGGLWWVPLAPLRDPALVGESAARALGASGDLADHIGDKRLLLLLDNFEHLLGAAGEFAALLGACPNLTLVITSREPLHIAGEWEYAVDPLDRTDAVELFLARALATRHDFAPSSEVAQICDRLDGLPLAIELAAARVKVLGTAALLERLEQRLPMLAGGARDVPERQRTLRATIEWSHELLTEEEQRLFARLAVFRNGWTLDAAEDIVDADLDTLQSLVDKSLVRVRPESGRYWMLETIREFAEERLEALGDSDGIRDRHADYFVALAEEAEPHLRGNPRPWVVRLSADVDNLRAAQDRLAATGRRGDEVRLVAMLWRFWMLRGTFAEGWRRLAVVRDGGAPGTAVRANALNGVTAIGMVSGALADASAAAQEALALHREHGNAWGVANSTFLFGQVASTTRDWAAGRERFSAALDAFRALGDTHYTLLSMRALAFMEYELGNPERATQLQTEVIAAARDSGNVRMEGSSLGALAEYAILDGRSADALDPLRAATRIFLEIEERIEVTINLRRFARVEAAFGDAATAARVLGAADAADEEMGAGRIGWVRDLDPGTVEIAASRLGPAEVARLRAEGRTMPLDEAVALVLGESALRP
jgi:predicted ATPase/class 3 adenylate cyclase